MPDAALVCRDNRRREALREKNKTAQLRWNGIDYVECEWLSDKVGRALGTTALRVYFLCGPPNALSESQLLLTCESTGEPIPVHVSGGAASDPVAVYPKQPLRVGHSYNLTVRRADIDPRFASNRFTVLGPNGVTDVDPKPRDECPPRKLPEPQINYLARDYASFRQLLLDRLALIMPSWKERHVPDLGVALVELFAYVGDYLAYYQDAVGTEAYLGTARQRISVRRHVRLVDYQLHEGCNARTFVQIDADTDVIFDPDEVFFITAHPDPRLQDRPVLSADDLRDLPPQSFQPFEVVRRDRSCHKLDDCDIKNVVGLIGYLVHGIEPLAKFFWDRISPELKRTLAEYSCSAESQPSKQLKTRIKEELNRIIKQYSVVEQLMIELTTLPSSLDQRVVAVVLELLAEASAASNITALSAALPQFFARLNDARIELFPAHSKIQFYTWSQRDCCLPTGSTRATLLDGPAASATDVAQLCGVPETPVPAPVPMVGSHSAGPTTSALAASRDTELDSKTESPRQHPTPRCCDYVLSHLQQWNLHKLSPGDILIFEEVLGPKTHTEADADPAHRQAVRLTRVNFCIDPIANMRIVEIEWDAEDALQFPLCISSTAELGPGKCDYSEAVSVARGNVLLVDHGLRIERPEWLGEASRTPPPPVSCNAEFCADDPPRELTRADIFRPTLKESDLTFAGPVTHCAPAAQLLNQEPHKALPALEVFGLPMATEPPDSARDPNTAPPTLVELDDLDDPQRLLDRMPRLGDADAQRVERLFPADAALVLQKARSDDQYRNAIRAAVSPVATERSCRHASPPAQAEAPEDRKEKQAIERFRAGLRPAVTWQAHPHLLDSGPDDRHFVVEIDNERRTHLRFGDDDLGQRPADATSFYASYRRGTGVAGNVGAEKIKHLVFRRTRPSGVIAAVGNPLPAAGGKDLESLEHAKQHAPHQFKKLRRAITADDYATIVRRDFAAKVQQARATLNWMGTWYEVAVAIDPKAEVLDTPPLIKEVEAHLAKHRRIGHLLRVALPTYVALHIEMTVCVLSGHLRAHVQRELLARFSNRDLLDGSKGFFHPDNFSFGDALYLSRVISEAKKVPGVENVDITRFERLHQHDQGELEAGLMQFGPLEIPRLDNDPLRPENGCFCLTMVGAR